MESVELYFHGFRTFIDATEQEIPRPKNKGRGKSYYSGKRKRHTEDLVRGEWQWPDTQLDRS